MKSLKDILAERILLLDGALSTFIEKYNLREYDYHKNRFINHSKNLYGFHEILTFTDPRFIQEIHEKYLKAGSDIIVTNTFRGNEYYLDQYDLKGLSYELNFTAGKLAREVAGKYSIIRRNKPRFVFGSVGPVPADVPMEDYKQIYGQQIKGLLAGNVDGIILECFDSEQGLLQVITVLEEIMQKRKRKIYVILAANVNDEGKFFISNDFITRVEEKVNFVDILAVGQCCGRGPDRIFKDIKELSASVNYPIVVCPNADTGEEEEKLSAPEFAALIKRFLDEKLVNIIGGCFGTTPEYIEILANLIKNYQPREFTA